MQLIDEEEEEEEEGRHWMEKLFQEDKLQLLNFMQLSLALSHIFSFLSPTHPFFFFYDFFCVSFNHWVELSWVEGRRWRRWWLLPYREKTLQWGKKLYSLTTDCLAKQQPWGDWLIQFSINGLRQWRQRRGREKERWLIYTIA